MSENKVKLKSQPSIWQTKNGWFWQKDRIKALQRVLLCSGGCVMQTRYNRYVAMCAIQFRFLLFSFILTETIRELTLFRCYRYCLYVYIIIIIIFNGSLFWWHQTLNYKNQNTHDERKRQKKKKKIAHRWFSSYVSNIMATLLYDVKWIE